VIRLILFFVAVAVVGLGLGWLADRPGTIDLVWQGWRIQTSVAVAIGAVFIAFIILALLWWLLRLLFGGPDAVSGFVRGRRARRGRAAIARGLVAVGVGDLRTARRASAEADRHAAGDPLTLVLRAQAAQLGGDREAAERAFRAMLGNGETRALGQRGLFIEARRRGDAAAAREIADAALNHAPNVPWAGPALLELEAAQHDWGAAIATVERNVANRTTDKATGKRQRAVLLAALACDAAARGDTEGARRAALDAVHLAPGLVPAAALAGRILAEAGELRHASRILEAAWSETPHPDLAEVYLHVRIGDAAQDRLKRARVLADRANGNPEGALALARAAIDARDFELARRTLEPLTASRPSRRTCLLMAEIEEADTGDRGRARAWLARGLVGRPDPAWMSDGIAYESWQPASPTTGELDSFEWRVPEEHLAAPDSKILEAEVLATESQPEAPEAVAGAALPSPASAMAEAGAAAAPEPPSAPKEPSRPQPSPSPRRGAAPVETIMPIRHLPDDPGPEGADADPTRTGEP
jgi:HemY protein